MSLLLKNVHVIDLNSPSHRKESNILIEKGLITSLNGGPATKEFDLKGKYVSVGWLDLNAHFSDPGNEHREDLDSGSKLAVAGGFTDVCLSPDTEPPIESKSDVNYLRKRSSDSLDIHVHASVSEGLEGKNLTEMLDLYEAGSVAFSEGDKAIWNAELLLKALQYTKGIGVPVFQNPRDLHLSANTHMHEGVFSTNLGLRGEPSLSEELVIGSIYELDYKNVPEKNHETELTIPSNDYQMLMMKTSIQTYQDEWLKVNESGLTVKLILDNLVVPRKKAKLTYQEDKPIREDIGFEIEYID